MVSYPDPGYIRRQPESTGTKMLRGQASWQSRVQYTKDMIALVGGEYVVTGLFAELRRGNLFPVGAAYAFVGWVILPIVGTVSGPLGLPE